MKEHAPPDWLEASVKFGVEEATNNALEVAADMAEQWAAVVERRIYPNAAHVELRKVAGMIRQLKRGAS